MAIANEFTSETVSRFRIGHMGGRMGDFEAAADERVRDVLIRARLQKRGVSEFIQLMNELGFPLPPMPRGWYEEIESWGLQQAYSSHHAMAQHHGVPTAVLDWTYNPAFAAFFAAEKIEKDDCPQLAVWALNQSACKRQQGNVQWLEVDRSAIGYLHRQEGVQTYFNHGGLRHYLQRGEWPRLESLVPKLHLRQYTLPRDEAGKLLKMLAAERVTRAHLMPTHDNIAEAVRKAWESGIALFEEA